MFEIGMKVICIDDRLRNNPPPEIIAPKKGQIYTIRNIHQSISDPNKIGLLFKEIDNKHIDCWREISFDSIKFRPLDSYLESERWAETLLESIEEEIEVLA